MDELKDLSGRGDLPLSQDLTFLCSLGTLKSYPSTTPLDFQGILSSLWALVSRGACPIL